MLHLHEGVQELVAQDAAGVQGGAAGERRRLLVEVHLEQGGVAVGAPLPRRGDAVGALREEDEAAAEVAAEPPLGGAYRVEHERSSAAALRAGADAERDERVAARRVRAEGAGHPRLGGAPGEELLHPFEGGAVVAVGAEREGLALGAAGGEEEQLEAVQRAGQFLVELVQEEQGESQAIGRLVSRTEIIIQLGKKAMEPATGAGQEEVP